MLGDIKKWFWETFDKELELNYLLILRGLTGYLIESPTAVNELYLREKPTGIFYAKVASLLLEQEKLENDILMPFVNTNIRFSIHSLSLKKYLSSTSFNSMYDSLDFSYLSKYHTDKNTLNDDFSYLLGNFVKYYKNGAFRCEDHKRLYLLTLIIERFCHRKDSVTLKISSPIGGSHVKLDNITLIEKLEYCQTTLLKQ